MSIECDFCKEKMELEFKYKNRLTRILCTLCWIIFPIVLIFLAYTERINYGTAAIIVTLFHFVAIYLLIKKMNYSQKIS